MPLTRAIEASVKAWARVSRDVRPEAAPLRGDGGRREFRGFARTEPHSLEVQGLKIEVEGDVARINGKTGSQADREKVILAVGNTKGIAKVDDRLEVMTAEPEATFYTVVSGDSLSKISKAHYGDAGKYPVISEANRPMLAHPDKIYPGQKLRIPPQA